MVCSRGCRVSEAASVAADHSVVRGSDMRNGVGDQRSRGPSEAHCTASACAATAKILRSHGKQERDPVDDLADDRVVGHERDATPAALGLALQQRVLPHRAHRVALELLAEHEHQIDFAPLRDRRIDRRVDRGLVVRRLDGADRAESDDALGEFVQLLDHAPIMPCLTPAAPGFSGRGDPRGAVAARGAARGRRSPRSAG